MPQKQPPAKTAVWTPSPDMGASPAGFGNSTADSASAVAPTSDPASESTTTSSRLFVEREGPRGAGCMKSGDMRLPRERRRYGPLYGTAARSPDTLSRFRREWRARFRDQYGGAR